MRYNTNAYVVNHVNLTISKKLPSTTIKFTKKTFNLVKALHSVGCINHYTIKTFDNTKLITFNVLFFRNTTFYKGIRLISTPSKKHTTSLRALRVLSYSLKASILLLSTPYGIINHREAIKLKTGGLLLCFIS
jgi:ribosomal protein S8